MSVAEKKPPTQIAGVDGIAPKPIVLTPEPPAVIDWERILGLPPFQMFAAEQDPKLSEAFEMYDNHAVDEWMRQYDRAELYQSYCQWHKEKGYWPNETPEGNPL